MNIARPVLFALVAAACGDDPVRPHLAHDVVIDAPATALQYRDSLALGAVVRDGSGSVMPDHPVTWSSGNTGVVAVDQRGVARGVWPGSATIEASARARSDSVALIVMTDGCELIQAAALVGHGFEWTQILSGFTRPRGGASPWTDYHGVPLFWGSGVVFGTSADTILVGFDYWGGNSDFQTGVCQAADGAMMHTVSLLRVRTGGADVPDATVNGLVVVQEQWAFSDAQNDDFLIFRYSFTNTGPAPIENLRTGVVADYDVYEADTNVASYDPETQAASVVSADSANRPVTGGIVLLAGDVAAYRVAPTGGPSPTRADHFALLTPGVWDASPSSTHDVKQILAATPFTLGPGETMHVGYALVAGGSRHAFEANAAAARLKAAHLWGGF